MVGLRNRDALSVVGQNEADASRTVCGSDNINCKRSYIIGLTVDSNYFTVYVLFLTVIPMTVSMTMTHSSTS
jgi:hypothetical protein